MREIAPNHEQHWFDIYGKIALTGQSLRFENRAAALGRWYEVYAFRVGAPESRLVAIFFNDITARKTTEEALRESEERFRASFNQAAVGMAIASMDGRFKLVNNRFAEILGYTKEELLLYTFRDITWRIQL